MDWSPGWTSSATQAPSGDTSGAKGVIIFSDETDEQAQARQDLEKMDDNEMQRRKSACPSCAAKKDDTPHDEKWDQYRESDNVEDRRDWKTFGYDANGNAYSVTPDGMVVQDNNWRFQSQQGGIAASPSWGDAHGLDGPLPPLTNTAPSSWWASPPPPLTQ